MKVEYKGVFSMFPFLLLRSWRYNNKVYHFGQLVSHISAINMQKMMQIFSLLKIIKFYLMIAKLQMFSIIIFNQSLKIFTCLNGYIIINKFRPQPSIIRLIISIIRLIISIIRLLIIKLIISIIKLKQKLSNKRNFVV